MNQAINAIKMIVSALEKDRIQFLRLNGVLDEVLSTGVEKYKCLIDGIEYFIAFFDTGVLRELSLTLNKEAVYDTNWMSAFGPLDAHYSFRDNLTDLKSDACLSQGLVFSIIKDNNFLRNNDKSYTEIDPKGNKSTHKFISFDCVNLKFIKR